MLAFDIPNFGFELVSFTLIGFLDVHTYIHTYTMHTFMHTCTCVAFCLCVCVNVLAERLLSLQLKP